MKIPDDKIERVLAKVKTKVTIPNGCPACGTKNFGLNPELFQLFPYEKGNWVLGGQVHPLLVLNCRNCGFAMQMSAVLLGLLDQKTGEFTLE